MVKEVKKSNDKEVKDNENDAYFEVTKNKVIVARVSWDGKLRTKAQAKKLAESL